VVPNPNLGEFEVKIEQSFGQILEVVVSNAMGKRCDFMVDAWDDLPCSLFVRLKNPKSGMYFLYVILRDRTVNFYKFIVQ
jgi:hypothetical protein